MPSCPVLSNDQFGFGNQASMLKYSSLWSSVGNILGKNQTLEKELEKEMGQANGRRAPPGEWNMQMGGHGDGDAARCSEHILGIHLRQSGLGCVHLGQGPVGTYRMASFAANARIPGGVRDSPWQEGWARTI